MSAQSSTVACIGAVGGRPDWQASRGSLIPRYMLFSSSFGISEAGACVQSTHAVADVLGRLTYATNPTIDSICLAIKQDRLIHAGCRHDEAGTDCQDTVETDIGLAKPAQYRQQQFNGLFRRMLGSRRLEGLQGSRARFSQCEDDRLSLAHSACLETLPPAKHGRIVNAADLRALAYAFLLRDGMKKKKPFILAAQTCQAGAGQGVEGALASSAAITWKAARRAPSLHMHIGAVRTNPAWRGRRCFGGGTSLMLISSAVRRQISTHCAVG